MKFEFYKAGLMSLNLCSPKYSTYTAHNIKWKMCIFIKFGLWRPEPWTTWDVLGCVSLKLSQSKRSISFLFYLTQEPESESKLENQMA
jgi:hypothetical protein